MITLPNIERQLFFTSLSKHINATKNDGSTLGLLLVDIVNLAQINHQFGYQYGDQALCQCHSRLLSISRITDTVFRIGDHQFVFILPSLKTPSFIALAFNKINNVLKEEMLIDGASVNCDIRIGLALNKNANFSAENTLLVAESSLKQSKKDNGALNLSQPEDDNQQSQALDELFESTLKDNDFELFYQPKINMHTGVADSAEALLRWHIPGEGFISPMVAIEIAEKTGHSFDLTKWVMQTAIRQLKAWEKLNLDLTIAINISADLILEPELFTLVQDSLAIWGVQKNHLTLEITETAVMEDKEAGFDGLLKFKESGVNLSIDDFGTGYSSLSYFKQIPANELKIDQSFVTNMLSSPEDQQIVKIIIDIGHIFDLKLVAEGIEDQQTYDFLRELGCDYGQGYHMSKPLPADEFLKFIQGN